MCAIIGWSGKLPVGLLSKLLIEAQSRGRDSAGIAYGSAEANKVRTTIYRKAVSAREFVQRYQKEIGEARKASNGIAHTRRASKGMPINDTNAHPFTYDNKWVYAHNGSLDNWRELKDGQIAFWTEQAKSATGQELEYCNKNLKYAKDITTDSMVLGPHIAERNFSTVQGCLGLVWIRRNEVYAFRSAKELVAATVTWQYTEKSKIKDKSVHSLTIVASTQDIIAKSIIPCTNAKDAYNKDNDYPIQADFTMLELSENHVYKVIPGGVVDEGEIPVNVSNHADAFTSEVVEPTPDIPSALDAAAATTDNLHQNVQP